MAPCVFCCQGLYQSNFTMAAGDIFVGYMAILLSNRKKCFEAISLANIAAAIYVIRKEAQPSIPKIGEFLINP